MLGALALGATFGPEADEGPAAALVADFEADVDGPAAARVAVASCSTASLDPEATGFDGCVEVCLAGWAFFCFPSDSMALEDACEVGALLP